MVHTMFYILHISTTCSYHVSYIEIYRQQCSTVLSHETKIECFFVCWDTILYIFSRNKNLFYAVQQIRNIRGNCSFLILGGILRAMVILINLFTILVYSINFYPKEKKLFLFPILITWVQQLIWVSFISLHKITALPVVMS